MTSRVSNEQIVEAYKKFGSVWKAAKEVGLCGHSVWERLGTLGYKLQSSRWSPEEVGELKALAETCTSSEIARRLGRTFTAVCCQLSIMGIYTRKGRARSLPKRGSGLDKRKMEQLRRELSSWSGTAKQFCIQRGLNMTAFVEAYRRHFPDDWDAYVKAHSQLQSKTCPNCMKTFIPMTKKQKSCSGKCSSAIRSSLRYFGGKRNLAVGMMEGICQLCGKEGKSLSAHHLFGKENDAENDFLVALCVGCHQLVGLLAVRSDLGVDFFEGLIGLAMTRRHGARHPCGFHVAVDIEEVEEGDFEV